MKNQEHKLKQEELEWFKKCKSGEDFIKLLKFYKVDMRMLIKEDKIKLKEMYEKIDLNSLWIGTELRNNKEVTRIIDKVITELDNRTKVFLMKQPSVFHHHFGLGLYIRNKYIYNNDKISGIPDIISDVILNKIIKTLIFDKSTYLLKLTREEKELNYMEMVTCCAKWEKKKFIFISKEGRSFETENEAGEDLYGYLINKDDEDRFFKEKGKLSEEWDKYLTFVIWMEKDGEIEIKFDLFQEW
ncbi:hypothetical protein [Clostridium scatologenes]|uniref:Uncharacterized protein n=1 Tax=Clostridium scatologenes TaxID=1548 RepID=A0A0E3K5I4_CLOSL|nr:hypothetical protein [Clostridium scatologenes]AKA72324.1 hypothetical protein CSCA_5199 [Clostridium scatologenes]